jgi:DNA-binding NtrC family response regulator
LNKVTTFPPPVRALAHDGTRVSEPVIVGTSRAMADLRSRASRIASGNAKVLITGESGVGKDVLARFIHAHSPRALRSFIAVNCAGLTETLLESELFGHVRGSFTGAYRDKVGKLRLAHTGTIFLDEVGDMSLCMQALLLRFLENGEVQPVGADAPSSKVDVRVIAATNRDLTSMIAAGQFREDLMYRLNVIHLHVPPLRERREDVRSLVDHIVAQGERGIAFSEEALQALERHRWPGNVRQLQNVIEQLVWTSSGALVRVDDLPEPLRSSGGCSVLPAHERRRQLADDLYSGLVSGVYTFWEHTYPLFLNRDMSRHDLRELIKRGLATTCGNYRAVVALFGMPDGDYKPFLNFLAAHECCVDFREFRTGKAHTPAPRTTLVPGGATSGPDHATAPDGVPGAPVIDPAPRGALARGRARPARADG